MIARMRPAGVSAKLHKVSISSLTPPAIFGAAPPSRRGDVTSTLLDAEEAFPEAPKGTQPKKAAVSGSSDPRGDRPRGISRVHELPKFTKSYETQK